MNDKLNRRTFIDFLGKGTISIALLPPFISSCKSHIKNESKIIDFSIPGISPSEADDLILAEGLKFDILIQYGDLINKSDTFGFNNDYTAFIPINEEKSEGILWVNHEYINPKFVSGYIGGKKTKEQIDKEMYNVGGSLLYLKKENNQWIVDKTSNYNRRINAHTKIPFNWHEPIKGETTANGTLQNCAGGITPWGTILTCEENYQYAFGERNFQTGEIDTAYTRKWNTIYNRPPEHYGWVVEVNPETGEAQKHVALGRCAHECATTIELEDNRVVVYTGDDKAGECIYKFISSKPGSLKEGTLYVANTKEGRWISLKYEDQPILQQNFKNQTEVLIRLREAAKLVGGTPQDRPEDIEIDPVTGNVLVALTKNSANRNHYGSILKIVEHDNKYDSLNFKADTFLSGGKETGFACPDNLAFDYAGNLWFTSDISGSQMNKAPYNTFKNNGLFLVPRSGAQAGKVIQMASAPIDAELTGPFFTPDKKTLFLSVQHPGEQSTSLEDLTSNWPNGSNDIPRPSVVAISGDLLEKIQGMI